VKTKKFKLKKMNRSLIKKNMKNNEMSLCLGLNHASTVIAKTLGKDNLRIKNRVKNLIKKFQIQTNLLLQKRRNCRNMLLVLQPN
jgi:hypothetical protein